jgi:lysophospholipase L1-like esterase
MTGLVRALVISALLLFGAATASPAAADNARTTAPLELSLGDSWAFGFGADVPSDGGYVPRLHDALQEDFSCPATGYDEGLTPGACPQLQLRNLAVGGATIATMVQNQYPQATQLLRERNGNLNPRDDVELVTLHIGGNDLGPILPLCGADPTCIAAQLDLIQVRLDAALSELRNAAGPNATIVIGTYDNPYRDQSRVTCSVAGDPTLIFLANLVLEGGPGDQGFQGLHDIIRAVAASYNIKVAEVFLRLNTPADWHDCVPGHPTDSGYVKVTAAFLAALEQSG